ncbi:MAG: hypothetical protein H0V88_00450 [Pyrinomonadaceae bacterium]|nr:hypothetical protein [Pyrinomonadaceae bacterium]
MRSSITTRFHKLKTCPSTANLLRYTQAALDVEEQEKIAAHLLACDFCGAELYLLTKHRPLPARSRCTPVEMPQHLRHLAQVMLAQIARRAGEPPETVCGERLIFTDA